MLRSLPLALYLTSRIEPVNRNDYSLEKMELAKGALFYHLED